MLKGLYFAADTPPPKETLYLIVRTRNKKLPDPDGLGVSCDKAYNIIVSKLKEISDGYRPESVIFYVGDQKSRRFKVMLHFWLLKLRY
ncbi:MAG: hypothetical protein QXH97_05520 [Candidatus Bathyarchaeia archaeon]